MELGQRSSEREVYSDNSLPQETKTFSNKQSILRSLKEQEKEQAKPKFSRREEIIKIRAEINETEIKTTETKCWFPEKTGKIDNLYPDSPRKKGRGPNQ